MNKKDEIEDKYVRGFFNESKLMRIELINKLNGTRKKDKLKIQVMFSLKY